MNTIFSQAYFNLRRPAKTLLVELINSANVGANYLVEDFLWGDPQVNTRSSISCNTELQLTGNPVTQHTGVESVWYNRIDLNSIFYSADVTILPVAGATMLSDLIDEINDKFGLYLTSDDYVNIALPSAMSLTEPRTVRLTALPSSLMFVGSTDIKLGNWSVDAAEIAVADSSIFLVNYEDALLTGQWIRKVSTSMQTMDQWAATLTNYEMLPSTIKDHVVIDANTQIFVGEMNYRATNIEFNVSADYSTSAVMIYCGTIFNLQTILAADTKLAAINDLVVYACSRGGSTGKLLLGVYSTQSTVKHHNLLVDTENNCALIGNLPCAVSQGDTNNLATLYTDVVPVHYLDTPDALAPAYVNVVISANAVFLRFLNRDLTNSLAFTTIAVDSADGSPEAFFQQIKPSHFAFTGLSEAGTTKLVLNMKFEKLLYEQNTATTGYTAPVMRFNGSRAVSAPVVVNGLTYDKAWFGCIEITTAGAQVADNFYSAMLPYRHLMIGAEQTAKSGASLLYALAGNAGYAGIRQRINPIYGHTVESAYPVKFNADKLIELRGMNQFAADQAMTTILDAIAEEVFYTDSLGVKHSRGLIWHLVGFAATARSDFVTNKPKALTYMIFDSSRNMVVCRQSNLEVLSFGNAQTSGAYAYDLADSFAWIDRPKA